MPRRVANLARRLRSAQGDAIELNSTPEQSPTPKERNDSSFWLTVISIVVTTAIINIVAYLTFTSPQTGIQLISETTHEMQQEDLNLDSFSAFIDLERTLISRESVRIPLLLRSSSAGIIHPPSPLEMPAKAQIERNEFDAARDLGAVAVFESTGFDWAKAFAKAQAQAEIAEIATWKALQNCDPGAASRVCKDPRAESEFNAQLLQLVSSLAEVGAFIERSPALWKSEKAANKAEQDSFHLKLHLWRTLFRYSCAGLVGILCLLAAVWLWPIARRHSTVLAKHHGPKE